MITGSSKPAIGFVTYNPGLSFYERLRRLADAGHAIYIFDNSPEVLKTKECCDGLPSIKYITAGNNVGLGIGLSVITATAYYNGYLMLLFFDQDTVFNEKTINFIFDMALVRPAELPGKYAAIVFSADEYPTEVDYAIKPVMLAISSGSLFMLDNLKKIGWHNSKYFVDGVDYELCLRARVAGYCIGKCVNTPGFDHQSEQPDRLIRLLGKKLPLRRYSGARIKDSLFAYFRLMLYTIRKIDFAAMSIVIRSFLIFMLGLLLSKIVIKKDV